MHPLNPLDSASVSPLPPVSTATPPATGHPPHADWPLLRGLNPEQYAAVTLPEGHALILAGAGSGKTRVLTTRIAWLLHMGYAAPGGILAVTFTNKAAKEMQTRLASMLPISLRGMWMGTFHGLCNRLLRAHHVAAGLPATFQILDTQDQIAAIKRLFKQYNVDVERFPPKQLAWFFASCKEDGLRPKDVPANDAESKKKQELYQLYEDQCQREGVVDFAELLLRSYELLRDHSALRQHYQQRFRYILVDEFQDTNQLQYQWLKLLAGDMEGGRIVGNSSVLAVGDDDQSIYAFRGARVGNMHDFLREFAVQHQIKLERNYRSSGHILDCANTLIENNSQRLGKNLITESGAGEPVRIHSAATDLDEARWLADEITDLVRSDAYPHQEIAVLYRSNAQSRVLESRLFNQGIPYRVYGGLRFFERAEIKHALAYLRLLENANDDTSFVRVVNFPARGIGARSVELLQQEAQQAGCSLHDAATLVSGAAGAKLQAFVAQLQVMREAVAGKSLRHTLEHVLHASGLRTHYQNDKEGQERLENLDELINAAESFVMQEGFGKDAVALPLDETAVAATLTQSPVSQGVVFNEQPQTPDFAIWDQEFASKFERELEPSPLLAVVSVDKQNKVRCDCPTCKASVYQEVHLVEVDEKVLRYGSSCFKNAFGKGFLPRFKTDRQLQGEEVQLLHHDPSALANLIKSAFYEESKNAYRQMKVKELEKLRSFTSQLVSQQPTDIETGETLSPLQAFLVHAALEAGDNQAQAGQAAVQLMTVHASKGLEFDAVFIVGLEEGLFPHDNALSDREGLEEERRLMYVAMTRARKRLYLSHADSRMLHGRTSVNLPSRFLEELPDGALKRLMPGRGMFTPKKEAFGAGGYGFSSGFNQKNEYRSAPAASFFGASATSNTSKANNASNSAGIQAGQKVFHAKFGEGKVLAVEGVGEDARAHVNFARHGSKWLALGIAKLTVVE